MDASPYRYGRSNARRDRGGRSGGNNPGFDVVDHAVVETQVERRAAAGEVPVTVGPGPLDDASAAQNGHFGRVDDGRERVDPEDAEVRDGDGPAPEVARLVLAVPNALGQAAALRGEFVERLRAYLGEDVRDEAAPDAS